MSVISEKVRVGLYSKLNVSGVTSLCNGVFESLAPESTAKPYVIFQRQGAAPVTYSMGSGQHPTLQMEDDLWLIKVLADEDSDTTKAPQKVCEDILAACETALTSSALTLSGQTVSGFYRFKDWEGFKEVSGDRAIYHKGFLWRVTVS